MKTIITFLFVLCSIVRAQILVDPQKFSEVKEQKVKFLFDAWKYHFGWKTLGGGYVRHILLITDESIVDIEMPEVSQTPGYTSTGLVKVEKPSDILLSILLFPLTEYLEKNLPDPYEKMRQEIQSEVDKIEAPSVENFVKIISDLYSEKGEKIKVVGIYSRNGIKDLKLEDKGGEIRLSFKDDNKNQHTYISKYKDLKQKDEILLSLGKEVVNVKTPDFSTLAWYIEALGNAVIGSVNLDYRFHPNLSFRLGASWMIFGFGFPVMLNFLTDGKEVSHHLEIGAGAVPVIGGINGSKLVHYETLTLGYRYQPKKGGFLFRVSFTPLLNFPDKGENKMWGGISIGYSQRTKD